MRLKTFHAPSMADAIAQVRDVLGEDAIIVATREEHDGGVRVTAAIEEEGPVVAEAPQPRRAPPPVADLQAVRTGTKPNRRPRQPVDDPDTDRAVRALFGREESADRAPARQKSSRQKPPAPDPAPIPLDPSDQVVEAVAEVLHTHGVPALTAERLVNHVVAFPDGDPKQALLGALEETFQFAPLDLATSPRMIMLVGPPGAGKTLVVAKMAARAVFEGMKPAVISTDGIRAGGVEQLEAFTRLLQIDLLVADDAFKLQNQLGRTNRADIVLIDTAGRNPFDMDELDDLADLLSVADIEPILVMAAGADAVESAEIGRIFAEAGAQSLIATRVDMTRRLGSILSAAEGANLSFAALSATASVAQGLDPLTAPRLADLLMPTGGGRRPLRRAPANFGRS